MSGLASRLLPQFSALREIDRRESAAAVVTKLQEANLGSPEAISAIQQLVSDTSRNRIFLKDIAALVHRTGQDKALFLRNAEAHVTAAYRKGAPPEVRAKLSLLINAVNHDERDAGSIEPGKRADLVVLDRNLFTQPAAEIALAEVDLTLVDGTVVYARPGA